jgi:hypothetical protein
LLYSANDLQDLYTSGINSGILKRWLYDQQENKI